MIPNCAASVALKNPLELLAMAMVESRIAYDGVHLGVRIGYGDGEPDAKAERMESKIRTSMVAFRFQRFGLFKRFDSTVRDIDKIIFIHGRATQCRRRHDSLIIDHWPFIIH